MAKVKATSTVKLFKETAKHKRKGVVSKKKSSKIKTSKNYVKPYAGQGR